MANERSAVSPPAPAAGKSRRGGLFTGIFIGILLGLAMALAVAVWLNVRGSPFNEREAPAELPPLKTPPAPAAAPATGRSPSSSSDTDTGSDNGPGNGSSNGSGNGSEAARNPQRFDFYDILPSTDPAAAPTPRMDQPVALYLQAGAFRSASDADDRKARLNLLGQTAVVQRVQSGDVLLHRIRVGPFANQAELDRAREFLKNNDVDSIPMRAEANVSQ